MTVVDGGRSPAGAQRQGHAAHRRRGLLRALDRALARSESHVRLAWKRRRRPDRIGTPSCKPVRAAIRILPSCPARAHWRRMFWQAPFESNSSRRDCAAPGGTIFRRGQPQRIRSAVPRSISAGAWACTACGAIWKAGDQARLRREPRRSAPCWRPSFLPPWQRFAVSPGPSD